METNLILESTKFMVLGMGVVFAFLVVMIAVLKIQAKLIAKYFPDREATTCEIHPDHVVNAPKQTDNNDVVAAITAAVTHHRK